MRPVPPGLAVLFVLLGGLMLVVRLVGFAGGRGGLLSVLGIALAAFILLTGISSLVAWSRARRGPADPGAPDRPA